MLRRWTTRVTPGDDTLVDERRDPNGRDAEAPEAPEAPEAEHGPEQGAALDRLVAALPPGSALLVVHGGRQAGARFLLDVPVVRVGRDGGADVLLDDPTVSRRHAEFVRTDDGFAVRDLNSLNGTYVRGRRVTEQALRPGDTVRIGTFRLGYHPHRTSTAAPIAC